MRAPALTAVGVVALAASAGPALGADQSVRATGFNTFSPASVSVAEGDSVAWINDGGTHNVKFDDGKFEQPSVPAPPAGWPPSPPRRTFIQPGEYRYYCELHGAPGGLGMSGKVVVGQLSGPAQTPSPGPGRGVDTLPPLVSVIVARRQRIRALVRRGLRFRLSASEGARIRARLEASYAGRRRMTLARRSPSLVAAGTVRVTMRLRPTARRLIARAPRLPAVLRLAATDLAGNTTRSSRRIWFGR